MDDATTMDPTSDEQPSTHQSRRLSRRQMDKAPEANMVARRNVDNDGAEDEEDIYGDDTVNQDIGDRVRATEAVTPATKTETLPTTGSTAEGPAVEPSATDGVHLDRKEPEEYGHGVADKQMEPTKDVSGEDTGEEAHAPTATSDHGGSTEVHAT